MTEEFCPVRDRLEVEAFQRTLKLSEDHPSVEEAFGRLFDHLNTCPRCLEIQERWDQRSRDETQELARQNLTEDLRRRFGDRFVHRVQEVNRRIALSQELWKCESIRGRFMDQSDADECVGDCLTHGQVSPEVNAWLIGHARSCASCLAVFQQYLALEHIQNLRRAFGRQK